MDSSQSQPTPAVGQIWEDRDERMSGRTLRITSVNLPLGIVSAIVLTPSKKAARIGHTIKLSTDRLRPARG